MQKYCGVRTWVYRLFFCVLVYTQVLGGSLRGSVEYGDISPVREAETWVYRSVVVNVSGDVSGNLEDPGSRTAGRNHLGHAWRGGARSTGGPPAAPAEA